MRRYALRMSLVALFLCGGALAGETPERVRIARHPDGSLAVRTKWNDRVDRSPLPRWYLFAWPAQSERRKALLYSKGSRESVMTVDAGVIAPTEPLEVVIVCPVDIRAGYCAEIILEPSGDKAVDYEGAFEKRDLQGLHPARPVDIRIAGADNGEPVADFGLRVELPKDRCGLPVVTDWSGLFDLWNFGEEQRKVRTNAAGEATLHVYPHLWKEWIVRGYGVQGRIAYILDPQVKLDADAEYSDRLVLKAKKLPPSVKLICEYAPDSDHDPEKPLSFALVRVGGDSTQYANFSVPHFTHGCEFRIPPGRYRAITTPELEVTPRIVEIAGLPETQEELRFKLGRLATKRVGLEVTLLLPEGYRLPQKSGREDPGTFVRLEGDHAKVVAADAEGIARFEGIPSGRYVMTVSSPYVIADASTVTLDRDTPMTRVEIPVKLNRTFALTLKGHGDCRGFVNCYVTPFPGVSGGYTFHPPLGQEYTACAPRGTAANLVWVLFHLLEDGKLDLVSSGYSPIPPEGDMVVDVSETVTFRGAISFDKECLADGRYLIPHVSFCPAPEHGNVGVSSAGLVRVDQHLKGGFEFEVAPGRYKFWISLGPDWDFPRELRPPRVYNQTIVEVGAEGLERDFHFTPADFGEAPAK